jgi:hypothetical protein
MHLLHRSHAQVVDVFHALNGGLGSGSGGYSPRTALANSAGE